MYFVILLVNGANGPLVSQMAAVGNGNQGSLFFLLLKAALKSVNPKLTDDQKEIIAKALDYSAYYADGDQDDPKCYQLVYTEVE